MPRQSFSGNAVRTTLTGSITNSALSFTVADGTGHPTGSNGPFVVCLGRGTASEEKVLCVSRSGTTFTVQAGGRGYDGTVGQAHNSGVTVEHVIDSATLDEANRIVNVMTAKGDLLTRTGPGLTDHARQAVGADNRVLRADAAQSTGMRWSLLDTLTMFASPTLPVFVCTSTTRPASPAEGQLIYETDTDLYQMWNGSAWREVYRDGAWVSWTPVASYNGGGGSFGTGATATGFYMRQGRTVYWRGQVATGTSPSSGAGEVRITLPFTPAGSGGNVVGSGWAYVGNPFQFMPVAVDHQGSGSCRLIGTGERLSPTFPPGGAFTVTGSQMSFGGVYETAA